MKRQVIMGAQDLSRIMADRRLELRPSLWILPIVDSRQDSGYPEFDTETPYSSTQRPSQMNSSLESYLMLQDPPYSMNCVTVFDTLYVFCLFGTTTVQGVLTAISWTMLAAGQIEKRNDMYSAMIPMLSTFAPRVP